ncbi:MAG: thiamine diphosphokinase [Candidatus Flexifilum sp.]|jgi:thiamine pyrophosphokinase
MTEQVFIFANGDPNDGVMPRRALAAARPDALFIAADGGARVAREFGIEPHIVIGDFDSITQGDLLALEARGASILRYPAEKDETDLELALLLAAERGATWIRVLGGVGDRIDQTLANIYLLGAPYLAGRDARLVAGRQETWLIGPGTQHLTGAAGDTISLLPLSDSARVTTEGLRYPLHAGLLRSTQARGVSNVMTGTRAAITVHEGQLLIVHTVGRA